jgi:tetratricopeptide (TPR) repeat protein
MALSIDAGDRASAAHFRVVLARLEREQGRYGRARTLLEESLTVFEGMADPGGTAEALVGLGDVARDRADIEETIAFSERSLAASRRLGDALRIGFALHNLAVAAWQQGDHARAERLLVEALESDRLPHWTIGVLITRGFVALDQAEYARAEQALGESLRLLREGHGVNRAAAGLEGMAAVAVGQGRMERAARLFGAAGTLRRRIGTPITPLHRAVYDRYLGAARAAIGQEQLEKLWDEGGTMMLEEAMAYALGEQEPMSYR